jgi:Fe-Mn family superoxide dismutase
MSDYDNRNDGGLVPARPGYLTPLAKANPLVARGMADLVAAETREPFKLPPLPYPADALEGVFDKIAMEIHHGRHHKRYVDSLNKINKRLEGTDLCNKPIEELLRSINRVPQLLKMAVRNNGGGHANHSMFWEIMGPGGGGEPSGTLAQAIKSTFGDFAVFRRILTEAALGRFGSGWAWLTVLASGKLQVLSTCNEDNPIMDHQTPLLGIDVWEHAYYLRYQNNRVEYIDAWWKVVNWHAIELRFAARPTSSQ